MSHEESIETLQRKALNLVITLLWIVLISFGIYIGTFVKETLFSFAIAILINYLLSRPVSWLSKFIGNRTITVLIIVSLFLASLVLIFWYLIPTLGAQIIALKTVVPALVNNIEAQIILPLNNFLISKQINILEYLTNRENLIENAVSVITNINFTDFGSVVRVVLSNSVSILLYAVLTLVISFYLLIDGDRAWKLFLIPFSTSLGRHLEAVKVKVDSFLYAYIIGQFEIAALTSSVMLATYFVLGIPYALVFGLVQMLEIIPVIGTWTAIVPCILIILFTSGFTKAAIAFGVYLIYSQFIRDSFVAPKIMSTALGFHPIGIIISVILGAKLGGAAGVVLALPLMALISAIIDYRIELAKLKVSTVR